MRITLHAERENSKEVVMEKGIEIEIMGYKATIERVSGQIKDGLHWKEDQLIVWLAFDEAVGSVLSFATCLPVKKYERDEFLYNVRRRGEEDLKRILAKHEEERQELEDRQKRQTAVDAVAAEVQSLIK
ncbi:hypothetical protein ES705_03356 [subsurface metagenome]